MAPNMIRKPFGVGTERLFCSLISGRGREHLTLPLKLPEGNLWLLRCQADAVSPTGGGNMGASRKTTPVVPSPGGGWNVKQWVDGDVLDILTFCLPCVFLGLEEANATSITNGRSWGPTPCDDPRDRQDSDLSRGMNLRWLLKKVAGHFGVDAESLYCSERRLRENG